MASLETPNTGGAVMRVRQHVSLAIPALAVATLLAACGGQAPAEKPAEPAAKPSAQAVPAADVAKHMDDHFTKVTEVHDAIIRGDLEAAREPARWIADHQETAGLPAASQPSVDDMKKAARQVADAADIKTAAQGASAMAIACGTCHAATNTKPKMPAEAAAPPKDETAAHMLAHQHAIDLLYQGLVGPSDEAWSAGAAALKAAPLTGRQLPKDPKLTRERLESETAVHTACDKAAGAKDAQARGAIYAELIGDCASCHALHGKVWGPGLPKGGQ
jgi:hypothetical protein